MTRTPIVDEYIPIAQRMAEIAQERLAASFVLPDRIVILSSRIITAASRPPPECDLCLVLHDTVARLTVFAMNSQQLPAVNEFLKYLIQCFPSTTVSNGHEIQMSPEDCARLVARLQVLNS